MFNKFALHCLLFFMVFSYLFLPSSSLQTSRRFLSKDEKSTSMQTSLVKENVTGLSIGEDSFDKGEEFMVKERMNLEIEDYPGTGANNHHDPNPPGRV
ncbi:uncharacterized protein [Medicago truncatula]|uniref:uncharacterized protein isoform X2 n=1 Tax=Medicago truncatula TaxID=3880 RepID=UPI000D2F1ACB|nr:uncharacterized protein LOC25495803 isoform X2 [Medicago truncatula]